jgi:hypothetical protein
MNPILCGRFAQSKWNMKTLGIFLLMAVASVTALAQQSPAPGLKEFRDSKHSYYLSYPLDWEVLEPSNPPLRLRLRKCDGPSCASFNIQATYNGGLKHLSDKEAAADIELRTGELEVGLKREHPTARLLSSGRTKIGGKEAFYAKAQVKMTMGGVEREVLSHQVQMMHSGTHYTLSFVGEAAAFNKYNPAFEAILSSFVLQ